MIKPEAVSLLDRLAGAFAYTLNDVQRREYLQRLLRMDVAPATLAIGKLIETRETFPRVALVNTMYWTVRGELMTGQRHSQGGRPDPPLSSAERRVAAQMLADEAVARRARGAIDELTIFMEDLADVYGTNATRQERGEALLPLPKIAELLRAAGFQGQAGRRIAAANTARNTRVQH
jgi:hypothetical protein